MSKHNNKHILDNLRDENQRIFKDLNECYKRIDFLQKFIINYRKILVQFSHKCVCNQSNDIINSIKSIEFQYKDLFFDDNEEHRQTTVDNTEDGNEEECEYRDEDIIDDEQDIEEDIEEYVSDQSQQLIDASVDDNNDRIESNDGLIEDNCSENNDNLVLVFNKSNNTIVRKGCNSIDTNDEFIINPLVIKRAEDLIDETIDKVIDNSKQLETSKTIEGTVELNPNNCEDITNSIKTRKQTLLKISNLRPKYSPKSEQTFLVINQSFNSDNIQKIISNVRSKDQKCSDKVSNNLITIRETNIETEESNTGLRIMSIIDGKVETLISDPVWSLGSLNSSKKYFDIFNALLEELRTGRIESFIDPKHQLISVFLRNDESIDGQNMYEIVFKCNYTDCQYESNCKRYIRSHVLRHEKDKTFKCQMCLQEFVSKLHLIEHRIKVHNIDENRLFKCQFPDCPYKTTIKQSFELHLVSHKTERTVKCDVKGCDLYFKSIGQMKTHRKTVHVHKDYVCEWPGCEANFKTRPALKTHLMSHTGENRTVGKIRELMKNGNYISTVDKNNDIFSVIRQQIISEIDGTVEIGPKLGYKCNYNDCKFVCVLPHLIAQHISTHLIGKSFKCDLCNKTFGLRKYWTQHQKNVHNINNSCPLLSCMYDGCDYQTKNVFSLKSHSMRHMTDTPFKCDQNDCDKSFKTKVCLKQHMVYCHTKVKPFVCEFPGCESAFKMKTNLSRHLRSHSKTKHVYRCDRCLKTFNFKTLLNKHLKAKH